MLTGVSTPSSLQTEQPDFVHLPLKLSFSEGEEEVVSAVNMVSFSLPGTGHVPHIWPTRSEGKSAWMTEKVFFF